MFCFNNKIEVSELPKEWAEKIYSNLLLFYIGGKRESYKLQKTFSDLTLDKIEHLNHLKSIAHEVFVHMLKDEFDDIGIFLHNSWEEKKKSNPKVTNTHIDTLYMLAREAGAIGGKILGAGGAGYMIFYAPVHSHKLIKKVLKKEHCIYQPFKVDYEGLKVCVV